MWGTLLQGVLHFIHSKQHLLHCLQIRLEVSDRRRKLENNYSDIVRSLLCLKFPFVVCTMSAMSSLSEIRLIVQ